MAYLTTQAIFRIHTACQRTKKTPTGAFFAGGTKPWDGYGGQKKPLSITESGRQSYYCCLSFIETRTACTGQTLPQQSETKAIHLFEKHDNRHRWCAIADCFRSTPHTVPD